MQIPTKTKEDNNNRKANSKKEEDSDCYFKKRNNFFFFFFCSGPASLDVDNSNKNSKSRIKTAGESVVECLKMERKGGGGGGGGGACFRRMFPGFSKEVVAEADKRKRKFRRNVSRVFKAVLFETSLTNKIKRRKILHKLLQSTGKSSPAKIAKDPMQMKGNLTDSSMRQELAKKTDGKIISNVGPSNIFNPTSETERNQSFQPNSLHSKQNQITIQVIGKGSFSPNTGLYLLLVSLLILVLWGKTCAILFTSTWFFFVPRWNSRKKLPDWIDPIEFDSAEYKKRIITGGLLERNRRCGLSRQTQ